MTALLFDQIVELTHVVRFGIEQFRHLEGRVGQDFPEFPDASSRVAVEPGYDAQHGVPRLPELAQRHFRLVLLRHGSLPAAASLLHVPERLVHTET